MATVRKVLGILVLVFIARTIVSCDWCDCVPGTIFYDIDVIYATAVDNSGREPVRISNTPIPREAFGISLEMFHKPVAQCSNPKGFFTPAMAFSCDCSGLEISRDTIASISIISDAAFNHYPAGTDLAGLFKVFDTSENTFYPLESYHWSRLNSLSLNQEVLLLLMTPPESAGEHMFTVSITLLDERILTAHTDELVLQ